MGSVYVPQENADPAPHSFPVPKPGIYTPAITFFDPETDELRPREQAIFYSYLANSGMTGLVILGTNAETMLLTRDERSTLIKLARQSVPEGFPIIAGVGGFSTKQVLQYIDDAHAAGANFALVLPCAYFGKQTTTAVVKSFYADIATHSPLPIVLYNFPGVCNGVDMDSVMMTELAEKHPNIVGVKLTCGSMGKLTRLAATFPPSRFAVFGGQSDFLTAALSAGGAGCISAVGNIFPKTIVKIFDLWKMGKHDQAMAMQRILSHAESPTKGGIAKIKYGASMFAAKQAGIEGAEVLLRPRKPYEEPTDAQKTWIREGMAPVNEIESTL